MGRKEEAEAGGRGRLYDIHDVIRDVKKHVLPTRAVTIHGRLNKIVRVEHRWAWNFYPGQAWNTFRVWWRDGRLLNWRVAYPELNNQEG